MWLRPNKDHQGREFYEYVLIYTDDLLTISKDPNTILKRIDKYFELKLKSIGPPDIYLGAKLKEINVNGQNMWTQSPAAYVKDAVKNCKEWMDKMGLRFPSRCDTPLPTTYRPRCDARAIS